MSDFTQNRQSQDDYNDRREAEHKRQEAQELDRVKNDSRRLDWLLTGDGSMTIDIDNSLDWCGSREAIDEAMQAEQEQRKLNGNTYFRPDGMMCDPDGTRSIFDDVDQ